MRKISKIALMTVLCSLSLLFVAPELSISASAATSSGDETVAPCADIIQWVFERRGNKLYKRQYNTSTCEWVGEWIYVRDLGKHEIP